MVCASADSSASEVSCTCRYQRSTCQSRNTTRSEETARLHPYSVSGAPRQRSIFARDAAEYVASHVRGMKSSKLSSSSTTNTSISTRTSMLLVSFSFVNEDLRIYFRQFFPHGRWILLDTKENMAKERIDKREGHFYKNQTEQTEQTEPSSPCLRLPHHQQQLPVVSISLPPPCKNLAVIPFFFRSFDR